MNQKAPVAPHMHTYTQLLIEIILMPESFYEQLRSSYFEEYGRFPFDLIKIPKILIRIYLNNYVSK